MGFPISTKENHVYEPGSPAGAGRVMESVLDGVAGAELAGSESTRAGIVGFTIPECNQSRPNLGRKGQIFRNTAKDS